MDVKEAIKERRSIRKYQDREVTDNLIKELIDVARLAPSGNNAQPWKFFVVKDDETKKKLKKSNAFAQDFVYEAPAIVVCCGDPNVYGGLSKLNETRAVRDLSIASSFMVLRATELGLGTCYVGWIEEERVKEVLDIPKEYVLPYVITVGYADEKPESISRKGIDEILLGIFLAYLNLLE